MEPVWGKEAEGTADAKGKRPARTWGLLKDQKEGHVAEPSAHERE